MHTVYNQTGRILAIGEQKRKKYSIDIELRISKKAQSTNSDNSVAPAFSLQSVVEKIIDIY